MYEDARDMSTEDARLFSLLEWLHDRGSDNGLAVEIREIDADALGFDSAELRALIRHGIAVAYLREHPDLADLAEVIAPISLVIDGHRYVDSVRSHRTNLVARRQAARRALLKYFYQSGHVNADAFLQDPNTVAFFGVPFTTEEVREAGRYLLDQGLVQGQTYSNGLLFFGSLTAAGINCAEIYDGDLAAYVSAGQQAWAPAVTNNTMTIHGGFRGTANQGYNINSSTSSGPDLNQVRSVLGEMRATLATVLSRNDAEDAGLREDATDVADLLDDLEELIERTTGDIDDPAAIERMRRKAGFVKRHIDKVTEGAATMVGSAAAGAEISSLSHQMHALMQLLGLS